MLKFSLKYLLMYKKDLFLILISNLILYFISFINPYLSGKLIDFVQTSNSYKLFFILIIIFLLIQVVNLLFSYLNKIRLTEYRCKVSFALNKYLLDYLKRVNILEVQKYNSAYLTQRLNNDSHSLISFFVDNLLIGFFGSLLFITSLFMLFYINLEIALTLSLFFIPLHFISYFILKTKLKDANFNLIENQSKFFNTSNIQLENIESIKVDCSYDIYNEKFGLSFGKLLKSLKNYTHINLQTNTAKAFANTLSYIFILISSYNKVYYNTISIGDFFMIISYFDILIYQINIYIDILNKYQEASNCYKRIVELLSIPKDQNGSLELQEIFTIKICNFSLSYNSKYIISNFNYTFTKGNIYTLTGANGIGKSSLIKAIIGLLTENTTGSILFNDYPLSLLNKDYLREKKISVLSQSFNFLDDSVFNNISAFGKYDITYTLKYLVDKLDISYFLNNLSNGINTNLTHKSTNISGGEKEKIGLLKTLLKPCDVLILDEPSTGLDLHSIKSLSSLFKEISKDKIILIITHDEALKQISDYNLSL